MILKKKTIKKIFALTVTVVSFFTFGQNLEIYDPFDKKYSSSINQNGGYCLTQEEENAAKTNFEAHLDEQYDKSRGVKQAHVKHFLEETWKDIRVASETDFDQSIETAVAKKKLLEF
jgi:hypothetical protein